jgi:hypothetical protein
VSLFVSPPFDVRTITFTKYCRSRVSIEDLRRAAEPAPALGWEGLLPPQQSASSCGKERDWYSKQKYSFQHWKLHVFLKAHVFLKVETILGGEQHLSQEGGAGI